MLKKTLRAGVVPVMALLATWPSARQARAESPAAAPLTGSLDRITVIRTAVARSPGVRAASQQAHAIAVEGTAAGRLPPPDVVAQVWQLPLAKPYSFSAAQMIAFGVSQTIPAPGALGAREDAKAASSRAGDAYCADRARLVARDADHAFADYLEATARHHVHTLHRDETSRLLAAAQARQAGGAPLTDVTQADVELVRIDADVATDAARVETAKARINALLARDSMAPLGLPVESEPMVPAWTREAILARAREARPELRAAAAEVQARGFEVRAADREATWPSLTVSALYFAPVASLPRNGVGANLSVSLPWLWGAADRRREAQEGYATAATSNLEAARIQIDADVATSEATTRSAAVRLQLLRDRALPSSRRGLDAAMAGYTSGRVDILTVLNARRAVIEIEMDIVAARAVLDHALADLDAAAGAPVPRKPLRAAPEEGGRRG
jgi:outer membrane protein TolC